jgi:hypothetical protein
MTFDIFLAHASYDDTTDMMSEAKYRGHVHRSL